MKNPRFAVTLFLAVAFVTVPLTAAPVKAQDPQTQNQATAIMRGYRTGYSDGYQAGVSDLASNAAREFNNKTEYEHGDRAYNSNYGTLEEYRDGYQQGFEVGYNAGFDRKPFDSSIPADLKRRTEDSSVGYPTDQNKGELSRPCNSLSPLSPRSSRPAHSIDQHRCGSPRYDHAGRAAGQSLDRCFTERRSFSGTRDRAERV